MNFQQLRIIRETVRCQFNLTEVANTLFTSQSGVSRHIRDLEDEIGVELFVRRGKRLLGLTEPGVEVARLVERMLLDAAGIKAVGREFDDQDAGELVVATTHTQARYALPSVVTRFKQRYPKVRLVLQQGSPDEIVARLLSGEADIGIATESLATEPELVSFPYYSWHHALIVPPGHPLLDIGKLTLADIAAWPLVTYHEGFTGRAHIDAAFAAADLDMQLVLAALDADVIKTYVELGLGVGIIASMAYIPERDAPLERIEVDHLFPENLTRIALRSRRYQRGYAYRFLELCSAELVEAQVRSAIHETSS
ncbi:MAG: CysB family HTH-type transcriptional regulator [Gammaproteobacteria bacterium]|nr:CysB family HTH-type transcriptional regulator [Gammaproteobacteria bacterium]